MNLSDKYIDKLTSMNADELIILALERIDGFEAKIRNLVLEEIIESKNLDVLDLAARRIAVKITSNTTVDEIVRKQNPTTEQIEMFFEKIFRRAGDILSIVTHVKTNKRNFTVIFAVIRFYECDSKTIAMMNAATINNNPNIQIFIEFSENIMDDDEVLISIEDKMCEKKLTVDAVYDTKDNNMKSDMLDQNNIEEFLYSFFGTVGEVMEVDLKTTDKKSHTIKFRAIIKFSNYNEDKLENIAMPTNPKFRIFTIEEVDQDFDDKKFLLF